MPHPTNLAISNWAQYEQHLNPKCYKTSLIFCRFQSICLFLTVRLIRFWLYFYRFQWRALFMSLTNRKLFALLRLFKSVDKRMPIYVRVRKPKENERRRQKKQFMNGSVKEKNSFTVNKRENWAKLTLISLVWLKTIEQMKYAEVRFI